MNIDRVSWMKGRCSVLLGSGWGQVRGVGKEGDGNIKIELRSHRKHNGVYGTLMLLKS